MCIQKIIEGGRPTVDCPECRYVTRIPTEGVSAMRTNLRLRSLAEKHDAHLTKKEAKSVTKLSDGSKDLKQGKDSLQLRNVQSMTFTLISSARHAKLVAVVLA